MTITSSVRGCLRGAAGVCSSVHRGGDCSTRAPRRRYAVTAAAEAEKAATGAAPTPPRLRLLEDFDMMAARVSGAGYDGLEGVPRLDGAGGDIQQKHAWQRGTRLTEATPLGARPADGSERGLAVAGGDVADIAADGAAAPPIDVDALLRQVAIRAGGIQQRSSASGRGGSGPAAASNAVSDAGARRRDGGSADAPDAPAAAGFESPPSPRSRPTTRGSNDAQTAQLLRTTYRTALAAGNGKAGGGGGNSNSNSHSGAAKERALSDMLYVLQQLQAAGDQSIGERTGEAVLELLADGTRGFGQYAAPGKGLYATRARGEYTAGLARGVVPSVGVLTALLRVCVNCGDREGFEFALAEMHREGLEPTAEIYDLIVQGQLATGTPEQAWATIAHLAGEGTPCTSPVVYAHLARDIASPAQLGSLVTSMRAAGVPMHPDIVLAAMAALGKHGHDLEALAFYDKVAKQAGPSAASAFASQRACRVLMRCHAALGDLEAVDATYAAIPRDATEYWFAEYLKALAEVRRARLRGKMDDAAVSAMTAKIVARAADAHARCIANGFGHGVAPHVAYLNLLRDLKDAAAAENTYQQLPKMHLKTHVGVMAALHGCYVAAGWAKHAARLEGMIETSRAQTATIQGSP